MGRIIGLIGGTCLLLAVVRLTNLQHDDHTLKADVGTVSSPDALTPRNAYRRGREMYLRGRYEQALSLLESATASTSGLNVADRHQAEDYLQRTRLKLAQLATGQKTDARGQSPQDDPFAITPAAPVARGNDAMRTRVERLMAQAQAAAKAGDKEEAFTLAQQAHQIAKTAKLTFAKNELTPAAFLAQLQQGKLPAAPVAKSADIPEWAFDTAPVKTASAVDPESKIDLVNLEQSEAAPAAPPAKGLMSAASRKAQAMALIESARADLKAGRLPEARRKALQAEEMEVAYDLFDDRPELVIAEVDRRAGTMTVVSAPSARPALEELDAVVAIKSPAAPATDAAVRAKPLDMVGPATATASKDKAATAAPSSAKAEANRLLAAAREDLKAGNLEGAQEKANRVQEMNVAYKLFEDRPELVLNDIAATLAASNIAQAPTDAATQGSSIPSLKNAAPPAAMPGKKQAKDLLAESRSALAEGRIDEARQLAIEAERMKATYGLFDDRPEIVLADIARVAARGPDAKMSPAATLTSQTEAPAPAPAPVKAAPTAPIAAPPVAAPASVVAKTPAAPNGDIRAQSQQLMQEARKLMASGDLEAARAKAAAAEAMNVAYGVFEDRPELILAEIDRAMSGNVARAMPAEGPNASPVTTADAAFGDDKTPAMTFTAGTASPVADNEPELQFGDAPVVSPNGATAADHYQRGLAELSRGNRQGAYEAFQAAHHSGERLDPFRQQRLQDYLRDLAPRNGSKIQLTNNQIADTEPGMLSAPGEAAPYEEPSPLDAAAQEQSVKFDRLRTDTLNAIFRAERLRESDPEQALQIVDQAIASVEGAELGEDATAALLRSLQKTHASLQNEIARQKPNLDQKKKNDEVMTSIVRTQANKIRVEQEFASLVDEYNTLYQQKRYAEAEVLAKKAKELDPKNPVGETMFWKARISRRDDNNENLKLAKEESFINQLNDVEWATVAKVGDDHPMDFGTEWADITKRRKGKYGPDNRVRSEDELRIEESLNRRISLHEDNVPLSDVMQKIAALAGFSFVFDKLGMEEEGVTPSVPVTIDVDGITVRSALRLMLEQYRLGYMVQDEVLKITSRLRQQGELVVATYPVADLVIAIPNFAPTPMISTAGSLTNGPAGGFGAGQYSVPPMGAGQPFAQLGMDLGGTPGGVAAPNSRLGGPDSAPDFDTLVDLISTTIAPDTWSEVGGAASIRHYDTTLSLVIRQTQQVHEEIADLLDQLRRLQDLQVTIEVRFVTVSDRFFERIGVDFDFNIQDSIGGPDTDNNGLPLLPFGSVLVPQAGANGTQNTTGTTGGQQGGQQQGQQQGQQGVGSFFTNNVRRELDNRDNYPKNTVIGLTAPDTFSTTLDVPFRQGSFEVGVPTFGGYNPAAGAQVGLAILSDIEAFFFVQAAQGDSRSNLLFAPKVTLFNGQQATVISQVQRPFVISLTPVVGAFSASFQPVIATIPDGVQLTVQAVISADRRFVRLTVLPQFSNITDVFTFSFVGGTGGQQQGQQQQGQQGQAGGQAGGQLGAGGAGGQGGFGGGQFGIGGGMGTGQMVLQSLFNQIGGGQGGQQGGQNQGGQQNQQGNLSNQQITVQQPVVEVVSVTTTVSVPDGGTVLLGGVKRLREGRNMAGVPILNKIPYVSRLFKNTGVGRETESLMLMVTPRIIIQEEEEELLGIPTE